MAAKPKLIDKDWQKVRARWSFDVREGFAWVVKEMKLPVSQQAVRKKAAQEGWAKRVGETFVTTHPTQRIQKTKARSKLEEPSKNIIEKPSKPMNGKVQKPVKVHSKVAHSHGKKNKAEKESSVTIDRNLEDDESVAAEGLQDGSHIHALSEYRPEFAELAYKFCFIHKATNKELAKCFGVTERTISRWRNQHPEFDAAVFKGKEQADAEVASALFKSAVGFSQKKQVAHVVAGSVVVTELEENIPPNILAATFWLKNRQPHAFKERVEVKEEVTVNVFPKREELDRIYAEGQRRSQLKHKGLKDRASRLGLTLDGEFEEVME